MFGQVEAEEDSAVVVDSVVLAAADSAEVEPVDPGRVLGERRSRMNNDQTHACQDRTRTDPFFPTDPSSVNK